MSATETQDLPYKFVVNGVDYTQFVVSVSNDIQQQALENTSSVSLRADDGEGNLNLLRAFLRHSNNNDAAKVYLRGFYDREVCLRMSGNVMGGISGTDPMTGLTVVISNAAPATSGDSSGNLLGLQNKIDGEHSVDDVARRIIAAGGWTAGEVSVFQQRVSDWYPIGRTAAEQLYQLAEKVGAKVTMRPPNVKVVGGAIKIDGIFDPKDDKGNPIDVGKFKLVKPNTQAFERTQFETDHGEGGTSQITPLPPGTKFDLNGVVTAASLSDDLKALNDKNTFEQDLYKEQLRTQDPAILALVQTADFSVYTETVLGNDPDTQKETSTTTYKPAVTLIDNVGKKVVVPAEVAAASIKDTMLVDFVRDSMKASPSGTSGYILTRKNGPLEYPYLRIKSFGGFNYSPPAITDRLPLSPDGSNHVAAAMKDKVATTITIRPEMTIKELAEANPDLFRVVTLQRKDLAGNPLPPETVYLPFDDSAYVPDHSGVLFPTKAESLETDRTPDPNAPPPTPLTFQQFQALPADEVLRLWLKRRAAIADMDAGGKLLTLDKPDLFDKDGNLIEPGNGDPAETERQAETDNNPYYKDVGGLNAYTHEMPVPKVFLGSERATALLTDSTLPDAIKPTQPGDTPEELKLYTGGKRVETRQDGKTDLLRGRAFIFDRSIGSKLSGEITEDSPWNFTMQVTVDLAVGEMVPGFVISCDETCGPLMGTYKIAGMNESLNASQGITVLDLASQRLFTGAGDGINALPNDNSAVAVDKDGRPLSPVPLAYADQFKAEGVSKLGLLLRAGSQRGLVGPGYTRERGTCSMWVRQVWEHTLGLGDHANGGLFGESAVQTGALFRGRGLVSSLEQIGGPGGLQAGDIVLQETGSNGYGHIGIYGGDGLVYQNSWGFPGPDYRGAAPLAKFGRITGVVQAARAEVAIRQGALPGSAALN